MLDSEFSNQLKEIVGASYVQDSKADRLAYSYDATPNFQQMPDAIVSPRTAEEVQQIVRLCATYKVPIVPRGSGTNLCAGTCPTQGGLVILFTRMNQLIRNRRRKPNRNGAAWLDYAGVHSSSRGKRSLLPA